MRCKKREGWVTVDRSPRWWVRWKGHEQEKMSNDKSLQSIVNHFILPTLKSMTQKCKTATNADDYMAIGPVLSNELAYFIDRCLLEYHLLEFQLYSL